MDRTKVLVFSVALNGYQWRYRPLFDSHRAYARRHGYHYELVTEPSSSYLGIEVAWLKIFLLRSALEAGYEWVMFLDADTEVSIDSPCVESVFCPNKSIYVGLGYSGEINSGVILAKNERSSHQFFTNLIQSVGETMPEHDVVDWGENANVIHFAKNSDCVQILNKKWNNNHIFNLRDYIRHYSAGPMQSRYQPFWIHNLIYRVQHYVLAVSKRCFGRVDTNNQRDYSSALDELHKEALKRYQSFEVML